MSDAVPASPARLLWDGPWRYVGYHGCSSLCRLRIYEPADLTQALIVIFTELDDNPGTSVTNRIEVLATKVWQYLERPERGCLWVENYPNRGLYNPVKDRWQFPEHFDLVTLEKTSGHRFEKPKWVPISRDCLEKKIARRLNP